MEHGAGVFTIIGDPISDRLADCCNDLEGRFH